MTTEKKLNTTLFALGALLLAYTAIRAAVLCITWDEAFSYLEFARSGIVFINKDFNTMSANDHVLNTALMIVCTKLFGLSEFILRIPALLAHLLFLVFSAKLVKGLGSYWLVISAFIIVNINPYLLDFFSLARGYGLSVGLMMVSIYYFYRLHTSDRKNINAFLSILFACFAALANFVLLNYCIVLFGLTALFFLYDALLFFLYDAFASRESGRERMLFFVKGMFVPTLLTGLLLRKLIPYLFHLKAASALFFGGENSFWSDTVVRLVHRCLYELPYAKRMILPLEVVILLIIAGSVVFTVFRFIKKQRSAQTLFLISMLLFGALCCLSVIIQHRLFQNPYLMDRTALFLVVLFSVILVFFIAELARLRPVAAGMACCISIAALIHFAFAFNFSYTLEWKGNAVVKQMLNDLKIVKTVPPGKPTISIGMPLDFEPPVNFYRAKNALRWLNTASREGTTDPRQDYYFLDSATFRKMDKRNITVLKTYPLTGDVLAKPAHPDTWSVLYTKLAGLGSGKELPYTIRPEEEYSRGISDTVAEKNLPGNAAVIAVEAEVMAPDLEQDNLMLIIDIEGKDLQSWHKTAIRDVVKRKDTWYTATFTCLVPEDIQPQDRIMVYLWNPAKHTLLLRQLKMKWIVCKIN